MTRLPYATEVLTGNWIEYYSAPAAPLRAIVASGGGPLGRSEEIDPATFRREVRYRRAREALRAKVAALK